MLTDKKTEQSLEMRINIVVPIPKGTVESDIPELIRSSVLRDVEHCKIAVQDIHRDGDGRLVGVNFCLR